ncbi:MAG TPA: MBL fold metallo-hydrolase [Povalibacter sp.]|uniref:MBL fold metallo-hydrolase n=1 Tax=Povalibacter sp. TaxID=1962978 RepID=UPI002B93A261|nr:MBL fold metallo-hydrolase [Povalibacter sp.]HMN44492.1 MBL fold metallo-hydrolase [Povalibacter sp.]
MRPDHLTISGCLILTALFATLEAAQGNDAAKITAEPVAGSVYVLRGSVANIVASVGDDGIVMVDDDLNASAADSILATLKSISGKPLRFVINTHIHEDHTGGNDAFQEVAPIIAHRNVRTRMASGARKRAAEALPTVTFESELNLFFNDENIRLLKLPAGHTDGDVVVFFTRSNVVAMGDVFMSPAASFVDGSSGGTIVGLIEALEFVLPQIPADAKVIPGHGPVSSRADVVRGLEVLKEMKAIVAAGISAGKTMEQLVAEKPFEKWQALIAPGAPTDAYVGRFYRDLTAQ